MSTHPYSSSSSQIFPTNTPSSSITTTTTNSTNSIAKPYIPSSLSSNKKSFSSIDTSNTTSPISTKLIDTDTILKDGDITPNHIFTSSNSFFSNGHTGKKD
jgi:methionine aminopeptidase